MRAKPRGWRGFARTFCSIIGVTGLGLLGAYLWQPQRINLLPGEVPRPSAVRLEDTGLMKPGVRALLVTAHPDDEAFYVGGTLLRLRETGAVVRLVVMTDGDKGYYPFHDAEATARVRRKEQLRAAELFGIRSVRFLGLPDGRLHPNEDVVRMLEPEFREFRPDILLTFDPDHVRRVYHRDHRNAGIAAVEAARRSGFEGWMLLFSTRVENTGLDVTDVWPEAQRMLGVHASQFSGPRLTYIQSMVDGRARMAGRLQGLAGRRVEPFRAVRIGAGR